MKIRFKHHKRGETLSAYIQGGSLAGLEGSVTYNRVAALHSLREKVEEVEDAAKASIDEALRAEVCRG